MTVSLVLAVSKANSPDEDRRRDEPRKLLVKPLYAFGSFRCLSVPLQRRLHPDLAELAA